MKKIGITAGIMVVLGIVRSIVGWHEGYTHSYRRGILQELTPLCPVCSTELTRSNVVMAVENGTDRPLLMCRDCAR